MQRICEVVQGLPGQVQVMRLTLSKDKANWPLFEALPKGDSRQRTNVLQTRFMGNCMGSVSRRPKPPSNLVLTPHLFQNIIQSVLLKCTTDWGFTTITVLYTSWQATVLHRELGENYKRLVGPILGMSRAIAPSPDMARGFFFSLGLVHVQCTHPTIIRSTLIAVTTHY